MGSKSNNELKNNKIEGSKYPIKKSVDISEEQANFFKENAMGFTKFVRLAIDIMIEVKNKEKSIKEILEDSQDFFVD